MIGESGNALFIDSNLASVEGEWAGPNSSCCGHIADQNSTVRSDQSEVIRQCEKRDVMAIGDKGDKESIAQAECTLNYIVVSGKGGGASVAQVREEGQAGIDCGL